MILDRDGEVLARSVEARTVTADPNLVADPASYAHLLAPRLGVSEDLLRGRLADRPRRYVVLARDVDPAVWREVSEMVDPGTGKRLLGIFSEPSSKRVYPANSVAANVLGFLGQDGSALGGIEREFDAILSGTPGKTTYERSRSGARIATAGGLQVTPVPGQNLQLTIDRDLQWYAQQAIAAKVREAKAVSGTVVIQDVHSGEILAMATAPTFDPNSPADGRDVNRGNRALSEIYEPGSIAKALTMSALLEEGAATPGTKIKVPGALRRAGHVLHDDVGHGLWKLTLAGVLAKSSNIGTVLASDQISSQTLYEYLKKFGIASPTGLQFPGESRGILADPKTWPGTTKYTVPFGQGFAVNSVQVASAYQAIANGGVRITPQLVRSWTDGDGAVRYPTPAAQTRVISPATAKTVAKMLEQVVQPGGTAPKVQVAGHRVAGKTGTAQFADPACGCYRGYTASFAGFAPAEDPQLVISVTLQRPKNGHFGGVLAGPVFADTMAFALQSKGVRPSGTRPARLPIHW
jgi:cell division protein FtsI (penicillin-binding protein 3)